MDFCLALEDGAFFELEEGVCLLVSGHSSNMAGTLGLEVHINGILHEALRGATIERRLNEVGSATVDILLGIDSVSPAPGSPLEIIDRQTRRVLFHGTIDEPVTEIVPAADYKIQRVRAVDGMRRLEDLRLTTRQAIRIARLHPDGGIVTQAYLLYIFAVETSNYDAQMILEPDSFNLGVDYQVPVMHVDLRGTSFADAYRAIVAHYNEHRNEASVLHVNAARNIVRAGRGTPSFITAGLVESIKFDRDRQHQHTRQCVLGGDTTEYTDTFTAIPFAGWFSIADRVTRVSLFDLDTPLANLPGVLWRFVTAPPDGYNFSDSNKRVLVNGGSSRTFYHATTPIIASATTSPAYVYYADWGGHVRLRFGSSPRTRDNNIQFVPSVSPAMLAIDTFRRVIVRRMLTGTGPYEFDNDDIGICTVTGNPAFSTGNAVWHEATSVIVDMNEPRLNYEQATTQDSTDTRPDLRVESLSRVVVRDVTSQDSNPREQNLDDGWRLDHAAQRVFPPAGFVLEPNKQLEITYTARWEVEADAGGTLPIIRHTQAEQGQTIEDARANALADVTRSFDPVDVLDVTLTLSAGRHVEPGERWMLPSATLISIGAIPDADDPPAWLVDAVRIEDRGDRLAYSARLTRTRHSSAYRDYWQSLQG